MAELLLMRHAKSLHPPGVADRDRPLAPRGQRAAALVGQTLASFGIKPGAIVSSPARRAADTARLVAESAGWEMSISEVDALYGSGVGELITALSSHSANFLLAVGHEPTWSETVSTLIGGGRIRMVTAAVAVVETSWPPRPGSGSLRWMIHPRLLGDVPA